MTIDFFVEDVSFELEDHDKHVQWLAQIAKNHEIEIDTLTYVFVSDEYLLNVNQEYLQHDYYTDIISFPLHDNPISGDIFISIDRVIENAKEQNVAFPDELHRVMAHGLLHFIGYDDHSEEDIKKMRQAEETAISLFDK